MEKLFKFVNFELKSKDDDKAIIEGVFSTKNEDRHGDVVHQEGWDLKLFKKNPVILNSHNWYDVTEIIGRASKIGVEDGKLQGAIEFAVNENPKAKIIYDLYANKFANAFSVGFIPKQYNEKNEMTEMELLEISAVSIPANALALAKQKGINVEKLYEPINAKELPAESAEESDDNKTEPPFAEPDDSKQDGEAEAGGTESGKGADETKEKPAEAGVNNPADNIAATDSGGDEQVLEKSANKQSEQEILQSILKAVGELKKVETRQETAVRAETKRLINKVIRELTNAKK